MVDIEAPAEAIAEVAVVATREAADTGGITEDADTTVTVGTGGLDGTVDTGVHGSEGWLFAGNERLLTLDGPLHMSGLANHHGMENTNHKRDNVLLLHCHPTGNDKFGGDERRREVIFPLWADGAMD